MKKTDLIATIAESAGISKAAAKVALDTTFNAIAGAGFDGRIAGHVTYFYGTCGNCTTACENTNVVSKSS